MFKHVMVPVDLHLGSSVNKALDAAADLAKHYDASITLVSVTGSVITDAPHNATDVAAALAHLKSDLEVKTGGKVNTHNVFSTDVPAEVDGILVGAVDEIGADLVVVGSHVPGLIDYVFSSHAGRLANHAKVSVFVVR